jgi:1-acyl-sn-glycerol-3-phosphate acyltransferase
MAVDKLERQLIPDGKYNHARFEKRRWFLRLLLKYIGFTLIAKINHVEGIKNVPGEGAAILMINHIAFIDPFVVINVLPRNIIPLAKIEVYDYPIVGIFPKLWRVIPVRRQEFDRRAVKLVLEVLEAGEMVLVAPEGTRSSALQRGKEGIAYLASRSQVPVIPVAITGTQGFPALRFTRAWSQPGAFVKFGHPFRFRNEFRRANPDQLRKMTDEALYQLAGMLPPQQRGYYSDLEKSSTETIEFC